MTRIEAGFNNKKAEFSAQKICNNFVNELLSGRDMRSCPKPLVSFMYCCNLNAYLKEQLRSDLLLATSNLETRLVDLEQNLEDLQTKFEQDVGKKVLVEQVAALESTLDSKFRNLEKQLTIRYGH